MFAPVADGVLIPKDPYARIADGCASDISLVIGSNADEFRYWKLYYEDLDEIIFDWILENNRVANAAATADLSVTEIEPLFKEYSGLKKDLSEIDKSYEFANDFLFRMPNIKLADRITSYNVCYTKLLRSADREMIFSNKGKGKSLSNEDLMPVYRGDALIGYRNNFV